MVGAGAPQRSGGAAEAAGEAEVVVPVVLQGPEAAVAGAAVALWLLRPPETP